MNLQTYENCYYEQHYYSAATYLFSSQRVIVTHKEGKINVYAHKANGQILQIRERENADISP